MKKTLVLAALMSAALALPTVPASAEEVVIVDTAVDAVCFVLPLLPNCAAEWDSYWQSKGYHFTTPYAWWTCKKADDGAGHLMTCETN